LRKSKKYAPEGPHSHRKNPTLRANKIPDEKSEKIRKNPKKSEKIRRKIPAGGPLGKRAFVRPTKPAGGPLGKRASTS
jgi:hypothetical protein